MKQEVLETFLEDKGLWSMSSVEAEGMWLQGADLKMHPFPSLRCPFSLAGFSLAVLGVL